MGSPDGLGGRTGGVKAAHRPWEIQCSFGKKTKSR